MAITNQERVGKALELLKDGLGPFVEREFKAVYGEKAQAEAERYASDDRLNTARPISQWDVAALFKLMWDSWHDIFRKTLGHTDRSLVSELRDFRNRWAHQSTFSGDDAYRMLDSAARLLAAVSAKEAEDIEKMKSELLRIRFDEQVRQEKRKSAGTTLEGGASGGLKPWREVATPHPDVASGRYQQAEFAADLWQVHLGQGSDEYRDPVEFFRRTYLTESLSRLLEGAVERLSGKGGDPVVQLQTNFGGGKTHSMLALYHLFSGTPPGELLGVESLLAKAGVTILPKIKPVVLVGNKLSPGNPVTKSDGTRVGTLWGELAWQLGGRAAYEKIRADDEKATNPGDVLRELFCEYGPCLILVDEWVAYARQLHDQSDLPGGGFETQFSFAQTLTESAKLAGTCLLVVSLPASDTSGSPHAIADDAEVGGQRGREALDRLRNVVGRVESSWRPASAEEGFEIVRRRLFEPMTDPAKFRDRDVVARAFADLYRSQQQEFPSDCRDSDYERRIKAAYPIHPEIFDRLYNDWSTLAKFQRTRGVLRLMASVIHSLWEKGDKNPIILPAHIPIDDKRVQFELTRYLSDNWVPVLEKDVDGPNSLPLQMDGELPNLGQYSACRRVARAIYMGSAPTATAANRGIEDRQVKLGCVMPGENPGVFGDALRRLAAKATYLYQDGPRYWYSTQPTVTKLAEDRAELLKRDPDKVVYEIGKRLKLNLRTMGDFNRVHPIPESGADVPDDLDARLVVLGIAHPYTKEQDNPAIIAAKAILESRGASPRIYRNSIVFLAADKTRLHDLEDAVCRFLAWESIVSEKDTLDLSPHQVKQAETQRDAADGTVNARLPETYQWLLSPVQEKPQDPVTWQAMRLSGGDMLAVRASKKLKNEDLLVLKLGPTILRMKMDGVPLWRGDHVAIRQLVEDFGRYNYLPRLRDSQVLVNAVRDGFGLMMWVKDSFAYAESYDEEAKRYRGLRAGQSKDVTENDPGLLVKPEAATRQMEAETPPQAASPVNGGDTATPQPAAIPGSTTSPPVPSGPTEPPKPKRYHGTVDLDPNRAGRDASRIADEVITHLAGLLGSKVRVTLEIEAEIPTGAPDNVVRIVTENGRTLKFSSQGFEKE